MNQFIRGFFSEIMTMVDWSQEHLEWEPRCKWGKADEFVVISYNPNAILDFLGDDITEKTAFLSVIVLLGGFQLQCHGSRSDRCGDDLSMRMR